jgi:hypothetical protein
MAEIVAAFGVPHTPMFPELVEREGPASETGQLYATIRQHLEEVQPDILLIFDSDHLNTFFFNNLPLFCVGVAPRTEGPNDHNAKLPHYTVNVAERRAQELHSSGIAHGFDLALTQEFEVDHSILVPLHFLTPQMELPIVPVFINGVAPPLPSARRCFDLGEALGNVIQSWPTIERVAILASGSFSLEVSGPKVGITDTVWMDTVLSCLNKGDIPRLLNEATTERMLAAGNVSGELLNWIALLGAIGNKTPAFLEPQMNRGHAYGAWRWD